MPKGTDRDPKGTLTYFRRFPWSGTRGDPFPPETQGERGSERYRAGRSSERGGPGSEGQGGRSQGSAKPLRESDRGSARYRTQGTQQGDQGPGESDRGNPDRGRGPLARSRGTLGPLPFRPTPRVQLDYSPRKMVPFPGPRKNQGDQTERENPMKLDQTASGYEYVAPSRVTADGRETLCGPFLVRVETVDLDPREWSSRKYADRFTEFLSILGGMGGGDESVTHPVLCEGAESFGRHIFLWDDFGFCWRDRLAAGQSLWEWCEENAPHLCESEEDDESEGDESESASPWCESHSAPHLPGSFACEIRDAERWSR